ncbi:tigger transposable element-derived protein 1, partial [Biomphalaria glabrata]
MAPKRKADSKRRKTITMEVKLDIVKRYDLGETATNIGRSLGLSRSTVSTIIKEKDRILEHVRGSAAMTSTVITKQRNRLILEMEKLLVLWLDEQTGPVSLIAIQEKAIRLFDVLKKEKGNGCEKEAFMASRGWFLRFKDRANLHNIRVKGEITCQPEQ